MGETDVELLLLVTRLSHKVLKVLTSDADSDFAVSTWSTAHIWSKETLPAEKKSVGRNGRLKISTTHRS